MVSPFDDLLTHINAINQRTFVVINRQMAIPAKNAFLEAPSRSIHMDLKFISAQTGGSYIVSKMRNLQFTDSAFAWVYHFLNANISILQKKWYPQLTIYYHICSDILQKSILIAERPYRRAALKVEPSLAHFIILVFHKARRFHHCLHASY